MPEFRREITLAAVIYEADQSRETDRVLCDIADARIDRGYRLAGTVQRAFERADRRACDMIVRNLTTGEELNISQDRGAHARGCRLDPQALEELVGSTTAAIEHGVDLLIINKFGKQEGLGAGFRDVIGRAVIERIPTLVAVNMANIEVWQGFAEGITDELSPDRGVIEKWIEARIPVATGACAPASLRATAIQ